MAGISDEDEGDGATLVFDDDRAGVARRAMPRLAVGTAGWCLLVAGIVIAGGGAEAAPVAFGFAAVVWLLAMLMRFDVYALQFGRPIRYELHADRFLAYRGTKLVESFAFTDVEEWSAASPASTFEYWIGHGFWRSGGFLSVLPRYSFTLSTEAGRRKNVTPPALFRWRDRGGLRDLTDALIRRLGVPINYPIDYDAETSDW